MKLIRKIAFPFVPAYYAVTSLRNRLYDLGIKKSVAFNFPVICVGNLSVGGTGKTPTIEFLINLLKDDYKVATLSRGYKRKTKGFLVADALSTAETLGDEPFQFYNKFKEEIVVAVCEDRLHGINLLKKKNTEIDVILLDDAFQHRSVQAGLNILLTTYSQPYYKDYVLPTGNLREPKSGAKRADIIIVTKCPEHVTTLEKQTITQAIKPEAHQSVFFSRIEYSNTIFSSESSKSIDSLKNFTLVTGIANANTLVNHLKSKQLTFDHLNFNDHHEFSEQDVIELSKKELILTTEKDFMRLKQHTSLRNKLFYLPITFKVDEETQIKKLVTDFVKTKL